MNEKNNRLVRNRRIEAVVAAAGTLTGAHREDEAGRSPRRSKPSLAVLAALMLLPIAQAHADNFAFGGESGATSATVGGAVSAPTANTGGVNPAVAGADGTSQNEAFGINVSANGGAAVAVGDTVTANGRNATSVGSNSVASGANTVAYGGSSSAVGPNATSIGAQTTASAQAAVALGWSATAGGINSTAVGAAAKSSGNNAVAVGVATTASGLSSVSLGNASVSSGNSAIAVGAFASATATDTMALGRGAIAANAGDVALGAGSVTSVANPVSSATVGSTTFSSFAGANPTSVVSVGAVGSERQITNVAAGQISAASTDAVNGSQLYAVAKQVDTLATGLSSANQKIGSLSTGLSTVNQQVSSLASSLQTTSGTATGARSVAVGAGSTASGTNSVALGANSTDEGRSNVVSIGSPTQARQLTNMAAGTAPTDGVNVQQLNDSIAQGVGQANGYTDRQIQGVNNRIDSIRRDSDGGVAAAMAVAGLPQPTQPGMSMVAVAGSVYRGQSGQAIGVSHVTGSNRWVYKAAVSSNTRGTYGAVVSGGYQW